MQNILITGANGQIGQILSKELSNIGYQVFATDINCSGSGDSDFLDVLDRVSLEQFIDKHQITQVYHLAAILSARGEQEPLKTWHINMQGLLNVLEACRIYKVEKVFFPSSIAVFGVGAKKEFAPNYSPLHSTTIYGISKASGENWCQYYYDKYNLDVRSLRYPGVIGWQTMPGGGTTDYAIDIFHQLIDTGSYTCFLHESTKLPMMYMPDAIRATLELMQTPRENIKIRTSYNIAGCSFTPREIFQEIQKQIAKPVEINYNLDFRNEIAASWVSVIDDSHARQDWSWKAQYNLEKIVQDMLYNLYTNINNLSLLESKGKPYLPI